MVGGLLGLAFRPAPVGQGGGVEEQTVAFAEHFGQKDERCALVVLGQSSMEHLYLASGRAGDSAAFH